MNLIYNRKTGHIEKPLPDDQNYLIYYKHFPKEFIDDLEVLSVNTLREDWRKCRVVNGELVRMSDEELREIEEYGKILSEEERLDILLKPSYEEIYKAKATLETLSLLQEVGII